MGIKLTDVIVKKEIEFDDLKGKKIAVDFSNAVYQFLSSIRQRDGTPLMDSHGNITSHLVGLFSRTTNLMNRGVKLCYVFDGKPPALKAKVKKERIQRKEIAYEKYKKAVKKKDIESMYKYSKQFIALTGDMVDESKELIKALGLPVIQAPSEADAQMAFMCEKKDVWACATSDVDPLLHGASRIITNLTLSQRRKLPSGNTVKINPEMIELYSILNNLGITQDQLIALSILVGTDYNPEGIKGIGPKTALKLVKQHKDFDELFKEVKAEFNWKQIYAIFKSMPIMKNYQLKWSKVDINKVKEILVEKHDFSEERVLKSLGKLVKVTKKEQKGLSEFIS